MMDVLIIKRSVHSHRMRSIRFTKPKLFHSKVSDTRRERFESFRSNMILEGPAFLSTFAIPFDTFLMDCMKNKCEKCSEEHLSSSPDGDVAVERAVVSRRNGMNATEKSQ